MPLNLRWVFFSCLARGNVNTMRTMNLMTALGMTLAGMSLAVPMAAADCDNYGNVFVVGVGNRYNCMVQHCDQGTGVGLAAATASGAQSGDAGATGSAGTNCTQTSGGNGTSEPPKVEDWPVVEDLMPETPVPEASRDDDPVS